MDQILSDLGSAFATTFAAPTILWLLVGAMIGLVVGVLPAIGATAGVILLLPFTFNLDLPTAIAFLMAIYATGQYGDSVASILLNTPGGPGTVASCWEGYPMSRRGEAARALGISTFASAIGGLIGTVALVALAVPLTMVAFKFQPPEYFALGIAALSLVSLASRGNTLKGLIAAGLGLMVSFIGQDPLTGLVNRYTFGMDWLSAGVPQLAVFLGLFALTQVIQLVQHPDSDPTVGRQPIAMTGMLQGLKDLLSNRLVTLRASAVGLAIGIMPGLGVTTGTIMAYLVEKKYSTKHGRTFGTGVPQGLIATETAKGTCVVGELVPTFALGIPGSLTGAIILAAFLLHGVQPGPAFLTGGTAPFIIFISLAATQLLIVALGLPLARVFGYILRLPVVLLVVLLVVLCSLGTIQDRGISTDLYFLVLFGVLGLVFDRFNFPAVPLVLGLILGSFIETNFQRTLSMGFGSASLLFTRPITMGILITMVAILILPLVIRRMRPASALAGALDEPAIPMMPSGGEPVAAGNVPLMQYDGERERQAVPPIAPQAALDSNPAPTVSEQDVRVDSTGTVGEFVVLTVIIAAGVAMVVASQGYFTTVALFPDVVAIAVVALALVQLTTVVRGLWNDERGAGLTRPFLRPGAMSFHWTVLALIVFVAAVPILGFLTASAIFCLAVPLILRYFKVQWIVAVGAISVIGIYFLADLLGLSLPGSDVWPWLP